MIHDADTMKILTNEETGLTNKLQSELLDATNLAKGTIFDNIKKINLKMQEKLKLRIDLRTLSALDEDAEKEVNTAAEDRFEVFEAKIESYIDQFVKLNTENKEILTEQK